jgi:hypothetical protein
MARLIKLRFDRRHKVRSLVWSGDVLIDPVGGEASIALDGPAQTSTVNWAFSFDRALLAPTGLRVLYTVMGTKGIVATPHRAVREINRSYYCANAYEYPVAVGRLDDGREVLVHCPDGYNRLTIEALVDGERLCSATDEAVDVFHSRLQLSPDGCHLLSAGWVWQPLGVATVHDIGEAIQDQAHLDDWGVLPWGSVAGQVESASWLGSDLLVVSTDPELPPVDIEGDGLPAGHMGVWSLGTGGWVAQSPFDGHTGTMHQLGPYALCLFDHPRLIDPMTAQVVEEWPGIATGHQRSSIMARHTERVPPFAVDLGHTRFAVANDDLVFVVELED